MSNYTFQDYLRWRRQLPGVHRLASGTDFTQAMVNNAPPPGWAPSQQEIDESMQWIAQARCETVRKRDERRQVDILRILREDGPASRAGLARAMRCKPDTLNRALASLAEHGDIQQDGRRWRLTANG